MSEHLVYLGTPTPEALVPMATNLDVLGYTLHVVHTAADALQTAHRTGATAIVVDIAQPEVDGVQMCSAIHAADHALPLVAINHGESTLRQAALSVGADLVLDQPVNWRELIQWLKTPRTLQGEPLAVGPLMGTTTEAAIATTALLAHDLKSPISIIISSLEVLISMADEMALPDMTVHLLEGALHAGYRQMYIVSDLLDLTRLELGQYDLQCVEYDICQFIRDMLVAEDYALRIKGLTVNVILPQHPIFVSFDHELLKRVISAMVDNVIKFTVRSDTLDITLTRDETTVMLTFVDTGRPITPGYETAILHRSAQWEQRQAGTRTSVAMGLPFAYAVAQAHGGDFTARSDPQTETTCFQLTLPLLRAD